jgi:hypothetical protein
VKIGRYRKEMTLFPYAAEVEYMDGELSLVLTFFDSKKTSEMTLNIGLDDDLIQMIEGLMNQSEEV